MIGLAVTGSRCDRGDRVVVAGDGEVSARARLERQAELAELFSVARSTVYRALQRAGSTAPATEG